MSTTLFLWLIFFVVFGAGFYFGWHVRDSRTDCIPDFKQRRRIALRRASREYFK